MILEGKMLSFDPATGACTFDVPESQLPAPAVITSPFPGERIVPSGPNDGAEIQAALQEGTGTVRLLPEEYNIDQTMVFRYDRTELIMAPGTIVRYHGTAEAFRFTNTAHCRMVVSQILCHHQDASGVVFRQSSAAGQILHCHHNTVERGRIINVAGRRPRRMAPADVISRGIYARHSGNPQVEGYFNKVDDVEIDGFDALLELGRHANAQMLSRINFETGWYGLLCLSHDHTMTGGFFHETSGRLHPDTGEAQWMQCIRLGDASRDYYCVGNAFTGMSAEPGPYAWGAVIDEGSRNNLLAWTPNLHGTPPHYTDGKQYRLDDRNTISSYTNKVVMP